MRFGLRLFEIFLKLACKSCFFYSGVDRVLVFYSPIESGIYGSSRVRNTHCFLFTLLLGFLDIFACLL